MISTVRGHGGAASPGSALRNTLGVCRSGSRAIVALCVFVAVIGFVAPVCSAGDLTVTVEAPDGSPFQDGADVMLSTTGGSSGLHQITGAQGDAHFNGLAQGTYYIVVTALGYRPARDTVEVASSQLGEINSWIDLVPEGRSSQVGSPGTVLAPKAQKQLAKAVDELRTGRSDDAEKLLLEIHKTAPGSSEVNYFLGYAYLEKQSFTDAHNYLNQAASLDPKYIDPLIALGRLGISVQHPDDAVTALQKALSIDVHNYMAHWLLASAYLMQGENSNARQEALAAVADGKGAANGAEIIIGEAWANDGENAKAIDALDAFVHDVPGNSAIPQAQAMILRLEAAEKSQKDADEIRALAQADLAALASRASVPAQPSASGPGPAPALAIANIQPELPLPKWAPAGVDETKPAVAPNVVCSLDPVLLKAGESVKNLVSNVQNIDANELLIFEQLNELGTPVQTTRRRYDYIVSYQETKSGHLFADEDRNGSTEPLPGGIRLLGLSSIALVFHPYFRDEFQMTCEGLGSWHGRPAWIVYFRQRDDKPALISSYHIGGNTYSLELKGRAWITQDSYQIAHMETDLVKPMPIIRLMLQHISVDYAPVKFRSRNESVWLPSTANLYFEFRKQRLHSVDTYSRYKLFSVGTSQNIRNPDSSGDGGSADTLPN